MGWRKSYRGRRGGGGSVSSIAKSLVYGMERAKKQMKYQKRIKRQARTGRRLTKALRSAGIDRGDAFAAKFEGYGPAKTYLAANPNHKYGWDAAKGVYLGKGAYSLGKAWRATVGKQAGRQIRNTIMQRALAGSGLYSGRGSYNQLIAGGPSPMMSDCATDETGGITVTFREYMQDVYGAPSASFYTDSWDLNPGLIENFPKLAQIAANYEEYQFLQLVFEYNSTVDASAINNTNGSTGTLIMVTNYNPSAPLFTNKETAMQFHGANSGRLVENHSHGVECDASKNAGSAQKYVRTRPVPYGDDPKDYDLGKFQLSQVNIPSAFNNQQIGELWVYYTVRFDKPRLYSALGNTINECRWLSNGGCTIMNFLGPATGANSYLTMRNNSLNCLITQSGGSGVDPSIIPGTVTLTLPDYLTGEYMFEIRMEGLTSVPNGSIQVPIITTTWAGNVVGVADMYGTANDGIASVSNPSYGFNTILNGQQNTGPTSNQRTFTYYGQQKFTVQPVSGGVDNKMMLTFGVWTNASSVTQCEMVLRQINPSLGQSVSNPIPLYQNYQGIITPTP